MKNRHLLLTVLFVNVILLTSLLSNKAVATANLHPTIEKPAKYMRPASFAMFDGVTITGPITGTTATSYTYSASVSPITATTPITYIWQATGQTPVTHMNGVSDTATFSWNTTGTQALTVTTTNSDGTLTATFTSVMIPLFEDSGINLPGLGYSSAAWGDFDNNGHLDILISGESNSYEYSSTVFRNDGNNKFTDINAALLGVAYGSIAWGDYNNDDKLDILLTGYTNNPSTNPASKIYQQSGTGIFTDINAGLVGVGYGSSADWGDYNADGNLDIVLMGATNASGQSTTRVYRNNGNNTFTDIQTPLQSVYLGSAGWGDYNNDGNLDIALSGNAGGEFTQVYRNDKEGVFTAISDNLQDADMGAVAWGDYDNDGRLDILVTGNTTSYPYTSMSKVYRNNGNGGFVDINAGLDGAFYSSAAWGDFNNDGNLDLVVTGCQSLDSCRNDATKLYRNNGDGTFTKIGTGILGAYWGSVSWGDYDGDGRLDLLISGYDYATASFFTKIYHNNTLTVNTPPLSPSGLLASITSTFSQLTWSAASDNETPTSGLNYNLRVGTTMGGSQIVSPMSITTTGYRTIPAIGNAGSILTKTLNNLQPGTTYYWSVQAIDTAFAGSPFATESSFTVPVSPANVTIAGPTLGADQTMQAFIATVDPITVTSPITYIWQATNQVSVMHTNSLTYTDAMTFSWNEPGLQFITVTVINTAGIATGTYTIDIITPDFGLVPALNSINIYPGQSIATNITLTGSTTFSSSVTLTVGGLPEGVDGTLAPNPSVANSVIALTLTTPLSTPIGTFQALISGTATIINETGSVPLTRTVSVMLNVIPNSITTTVLPTSSTVFQNQSASYSITLQATPGLTQPAILAVNGLNDTDVMFSPNPIPLGGSATLLVTTSMSTLSNTHLFTLTANTSGLISNIQSSLTVLPATITMTVSPTSALVFKGQSLVYIIGLAATPGFTMPVTLTASQLPTGTSYTIDPPSIAPGESSTLIITTTPSTPAGIHPVAITGTAAGLSYTANATLEVKWGVYLPILLKRWPPVPYNPTLAAISNPDEDGAYTVNWTEQPTQLADTYTLQEATNAAFTTGVGDVCTTAGLTCDVSGKLAGTYYYRVRGYNSWGYGGWSNTQSAVVNRVELIVNGGFESGPPAAPWVQSSNAGELISTLGARTGIWGIYMGGVENAVDQIYQQVTIPASAPSPRLSYWRLIRTSDSLYTVYDEMRCVIWDTSGNVLAFCGQFSNVNQSQNWVYQTYDMSAFKGQTVRVAFKAFNDSSYDTQFFVDDVSLVPTATATQVSDLVMTEGDQMGRWQLTEAVAALHLTRNSLRSAAR